jgi:hypothetical protein
VNAVAIFDPARRLHWKELYPKIGVVGRESINGRTAFVVETEPGGTWFYIDGQSGLLPRAEVLPGLTFHVAKAEHATTDEMVFAPPRSEVR